MCVFGFWQVNWTCSTQINVIFLIIYVCLFLIWWKIVVIIWHLLLDDWPNFNCASHWRWLCIVINHAMTKKILDNCMVSKNRSSFCLYIYIWTWKSAPHSHSIVNSSSLTVFHCRIIDALDVYSAKKLFVFKENCFSLKSKNLFP